MKSCKKAVSIGGEVFISPEKTVNGSEFVRLATNPKALQSRELVSTANAAYRATFDYARFVSRGDGTASYCPFVKFIEARNGYVVTESTLFPDVLGVTYRIQALRDAYHAFSPDTKHANLHPDPTVLAIAFSHPGAQDAQGFANLEAARKSVRHEILESGLMVSVMHPEHPLEMKGGNGDLFRSGMALLFLRRMYTPDLETRARHPSLRGDEVFIDPTDKRAVEAFNSYFGDIHRIQPMEEEQK